MSYKRLPVTLEFHQAHGLQEKKIFYLKKTFFFSVLLTFFTRQRQENIVMGESICPDDQEKPSEHGMWIQTEDSTRQTDKDEIMRK
jgi:hypothetical protein